MSSAIRRNIMARVPAVISTRIPPREGVNAEHLHHGTDDIVAYYCPKRGCGGKFGSEKDRLDHAYWRHAWCWECNKGFETLAELDHHHKTVLHREREWFCVPTCQQVFDRPSRFIEHIEKELCDASLEKRISEHWLAHAILVDHAAAHNRTNDDKVYLSCLLGKCITVQAQNAWVLDPLGRFYEDNGATSYVMVKHSTCLVCGDKWQDAGWLYTHLRAGSEQRFLLFKCGHCEAGFQWLSGIVKHYEDGCPYAERIKREAEQAQAMSAGMVDIYVDEDAEEDIDMDNAGGYTGDYHFDPDELQGMNEEEYGEEEEKAEEEQGQENSMGLI
ncbi:hypothetical protein ABW21_db0203991 [Orbilia brochopaga]|nr:hypothetical protein ABW21_db0203991 [Drechslerella brochopaga]